MKKLVAIFALLLLLGSTHPALACKPNKAHPYTEMTEQGAASIADVVVTGRVASLKAEPGYGRLYHFSFSVDSWQKGSGPRTLELSDHAHVRNDCDRGRPPRKNLATYYMTYDPAGSAEDFDYSWKVYAVNREGELQVLYAVPQQKIKLALRSGPDWEVVRLEREEMVEDSPLPAGTELITRRHPETHAIVHAKAILHQRAQFKGLVLTAGTALLFSKAEQEDRIKRSGFYAQPAVIYTDVIAPSEWNIGSLRINGRVRVAQQGDSLLVACGIQPGEPAHCQQDGKPVLDAEFGPGPKLRKVTIGSRPGVEGELFRIRVGGDVLEAVGAAEYWPGGALRSLTLTGRQTFRGKEASGTLRFWPNGNPQEVNRERYCRNGQEPKPLRSAIQTGIACDDGSLLYIETRLMCLQSDLARQKFGFLKQRPPGMLDECVGGTSYSIGGPSYLLVVRDPE